MWFFEFPGRHSHFYDESLFNHQKITGPRPDSVFLLIKRLICIGGAVIGRPLAAAKPQLEATPTP
jgi:hypothetical protein